MKVVVMVKATKSSEAGVLPTQQLLTEMGKYNEELVKVGIMQAGEGLQPSSKGVRVRFSGKDRTVTDGPFIETNELVAGFWLWNVKSMQEAIDWVKRCPNPMLEDSEIEIRPLYSMEDFGDAASPELRESEAALRAKALGLDMPRFETIKAMTIAGLGGKFTLETRHMIPELWRRFGPMIGQVPGQVGHYSYGVSYDGSAEGNFNYLAGVEVRDLNGLPAEFTHVAIPAGRYAVIKHLIVVSKLPETFEAIYKKWLPESGLKAAHAPCFERYTEEFDPKTQTGGTEIWVPVQS